MASRERSWSERMRDLIEHADRVRDESERTRRHADHAMKHPFWPDRRREPRSSSNDTPDEHSKNP